MACLFKYKDGDLELTSQSFEGLIQGLLYDSAGKQIRNLNDLTIDSLNFFNADGDIVNEVMSSLESAVPTKGKVSVTKFIKEHLGLLKEVESSFEDNKGVVANAEVILPKALDYVTYRSEYGTKIHNVVDVLSRKGNSSEEYKKALNELWEVLLSGKSRIPNWKNIGFRSVPGTIQFLESLPATLTEFETQYLYNVVKKINDALHKYGDNVKTEVRIEDPNAYSSRGLTGIIDAITWDNDGNVTIWDFKTTANGEVSLNTKLYRYTQLQVYKEMLVKRGIPADKIKIKNLLITDSLLNGKEPDLLIEIIDPETVFNASTIKHVRDKETTIMNILYPFTGKTITAEEADAKLQRINSLISPIISKLGISKMTVESQMNMLKERIENGTPTFIRQVSDSEWKKGTTIATWKQEGDLILGYDASGKEMLKDTLENIAIKEAKAIHDELNSSTRTIGNALNTQSYDTLQNFFRYNEKAKTALLHALEPYLSELYEYLRIPFLEENYNIITLKNRANNTYSFIVLSEIASISHKRNGVSNILDPVFKDETVLKKFKEAKDLPEPTAENLLTLQAMMAILECRDILSDGPIKIDSILIVSTANGTHTAGTNIARFTDAFKLLQYKAQTDESSMQSPEIYKDINDRWNSNVSLSDPKEVLFRLVINRISTFKLTNPGAALDGLDSLTIEKILGNLDDLLESLRKEHGSECFNVKSQIGRIYAGLQQIKREYQTGEVFDKLYKHTNWGLTAAETLGAGIDLFKYAQSKKYSFNGMIINGIAQGLETSVSYSNPDKAIQLYELIYRLAARLITTELNDLAVPFNLATKKFLREAGKSGFLIAVLGSTTDVYESLFELDNGKVAKNMQLKNPYSSFSELAPFLAEYIKEVLWTINRLRMKDSLSDEARKLSYKEFEKTQEHKTYVELVNNNPEYLEMPLKLKNSAEGVITDIRNLFDPDDTEDKSRSRVRKFCDSIADRWMQSIEPVLLTPDQASQMEQDINESERNFKYHSPYNKLGENRVSILEKTPVNKWEKNLNILTLEYACAQFKEIYFQLALHTVGNLLGEIDLMEVMTGNDLSKTKEALVNRVRISIYNRNLVPDEFKTAASIVAGVKQVVSFTKLALRPATFIKEMILGVLRNSSTILLENFVNDVPITYDHLLKAAGVVYTNGLFVDKGFAPEDETFGDFRLVGALNNLYRINDRDLNLLGESLSYDSHGILHWGSRMLYLNTTSPDWFNRMTLLVAKMMADGTWEAHSLDKDGRLIYDPFKDKRFKKFLSFYRNHPDLKDEPTDEDYIMAKARYTMTVEQLKREGYNNLTASDGEGYSIIPICYTSQEMDSVKEQIGMLYGYYSQEERSIIQKGIAWLLHTQFLTFLPGEIKKYFASGNFESSVGKVVHQTEPFTGKKLYYITNDAGLTEVVNEDELTTDQKTRPVLEFTKTPLEGLLVSTIKTFSQVWHGDRANIPKEQLDRTKLFFFNMLIWALLNALIVGAGIAVVKNKKSSKEDRRQMDAAAASLRILRSVSNEMNVFNILESSLSTMGITGYDTLKEMIASTMNTITSDSGDYFSILNQMGAINDFQIR